MSDPSRSRMDRLRDWFWVFGAVCGLVGGVGGFLIKFDVYYLAEEKSIIALEALSAASTVAAQRLEAADTHFQSIEKSIREIQYTEQTMAKQLNDVSDHVLRLDGRADNDRTRITDALAVQDKNSQQILLLLEPKAPRK